MASPGQWVLDGARWGGAQSFLESWWGLAVERSTIWVGWAFAVEGACWPSSPTSMASSLSAERSDSSSSEGGVASG